MSSKNNEYQYDSFISYRHSKLDKFVAEELHKQMESYRFPRKIARKLGKKKISRIFRDKDELPLTSNLADPITLALQKSEFLIVICSPRLSESLWCQKEIDTFIRLHGRDHVLAVLVEGEPRDSFPEALLYREEEIIDENGVKQVVKQPVEPLAADVRGKNRHEIKKLIKQEMLRLLAPMVSCNYDDLRQRHKERKLQKILSITAAAAVVFLVFGIISSSMALEIKNQKDIISEQYQEALIVNARINAKDALELLEGGYRMEAIALARSVLPDTMENSEIPYTAEARYALSSSLYNYYTGNQIVSTFQLEGAENIDFMKISPDKTRLMMVTQYGTLTVWDVLNHEKLLEMSFPGEMYPNETEYAFAGNDKIAYLDETGLVIQTIASGNAEHFYELGYMLEVTSDKQGNYLAATDGKTLVVYDLSDNSVCYTCKAGEERSFYQCMEFIDDGVLAYTLVDAAMGNLGNNDIVVCDVTSDEIVNTFHTDFKNVSRIAKMDDYLYVVTNDLSASDLEELASVIYCFDLTSAGREVWTYTSYSGYYDDVVIPSNENENLLLVSYNDIDVVNKVTGEKVAELNYDSEIVTVQRTNDANTFLCFTRDGTFHTVSTNDMTDYVLAERFDVINTNVEEFLWGKDFYICKNYSSNHALVYEWYQDENVTDVTTFEGSISEMKVNTAGDKALITYYNYGLDTVVTLYDLEKKEELCKVQVDGSFGGMCFLEDESEQFVLLASDEIYYYDQDGTVRKKASIGEMDALYFSKGFINDGEYIVGDDMHNISIYNLSNGKVEKTISKDEGLLEEFGEMYAVGNTLQTYAATDITDKKLGIYDIDEREPYKEVDINASFINDMWFNEDDTELYVTYKDGKVEVYDTTDLSLKKTIDTIDDAVDKISFTSEGTYLFTAYGAYLLNDNLEIEDYIPNMEAVSSSRREYYISYYKNLYSAPVYSYEQLIQKADNGFI